MTRRSGVGRHEASGIRELVEAALALLLFTDALAIRVKALRRDEFLPIRLAIRLRGLSG